MAVKRDVSNELEMMKAVSEVLLQRRENPGIDSENLMKLVIRFITKEGLASSKVYMIAAASKAVEMISKNPSFTDKEIIRNVMADLRDISANIDIENRKVG